MIRSGLRERGWGTYSFFKGRWQGHLVTSSAEGFKELNEDGFEVSVLVEFIHLNHHGHVETDVALSADEVVVNQT